jgi:hypothetical protein
VIGEAGKRLQTHVLETNGRALVEAVRLIPGRKHLVFEEGTQSAWLYEILEPHVDELVVVNPGKERGQKNDKIDAYARAEELRRGTLGTRVFKALNSLRSCASWRRATSASAATWCDPGTAQERVPPRGVPTPGERLRDTRAGGLAERLPLPSRRRAQALSRSSTSWWSTSSAPRRS